MLEEIRDLGFGYAELSHGVRISLLPGILDAVDAGVIRITSVHNFCPLPLGVERAAPNIFKFSSEDSREREQAFKHTLKSMDTAARVGAPVVVLHMGNIGMRDSTDQLLEMVSQSKASPARVDKLLQEVIDQRERRKERAEAAAYGMLRQLIPEAEKRGLHLGIENREAVHEIPFECDLPFFFREFTSPVVGYWHDTGHAQIKEMIGLIYHHFHLENHVGRLLGLHVHDVNAAGRDHQVPGTGRVDFAKLAPLIRPDHLKVLEIGPGAPTADVLAGYRYLQKVWGPE